jgi:hypothetical protein
MTVFSDKRTIEMHGGLNTLTVGDLIYYLKQLREKGIPLGTKVEFDVDTSYLHTWRPALRVRVTCPQSEVRPGSAT